MPIGSLPWYQLPAVWSAIAAAFSATAALLTYLLFRRNFASQRKDTIVHKLIDQNIEINEAIVRHGIRGPYGYLLKKEPTEIKEFNGKATILLNHLNLLYTVFSNRQLLGGETEKAYENWMVQLLHPWILNDLDFLKVWTLATMRQDLWEPEFIQWLSRHLPKPRPALIYPPQTQP